MREALVELVFMMVILKLPIVYLCWVVYWAIKAEPRPLEGAPLPVAPVPDPCPWRRSPRSRVPSGPRGSRRVARARARAWV